MWNFVIDTQMVLKKKEKKRWYQYMVGWKLSKYDMEIEFKLKCSTTPNYTTYIII